MQTMNISLPDPMKQYVEEQVSAGGYSSASEFVRELVRGDQKQKAKEALERTLLAALQGGEAVKATPELWQVLRDEMKKKARSRKTSKEP